MSLDNFPVFDSLIRPVALHRVSGSTIAMEALMTSLGERAQMLRHLPFDQVHLQGRESTYQDALSNFANSNTRGRSSTSRAQGNSFQQLEKQEVHRNSRYGSFYCGTASRSNSIRNVQDHTVNLTVCSAAKKSYRKPLLVRHSNTRQIR